MSYSLANVEARAAAHPTFQIPLPSERRNLRPGDLVKLVFCCVEPTEQPAAERMWVKVTVISADCAYEGELLNDPVFVPLNHGAEIKFGPEHIAAIEPASGFLP